MPLKNNWANGDLFTPAAANDMANAVNEAAYLVSAATFGAVGDGSTDDTTALQNWINYITTNKSQGWLPNGTYKITSTLVTAGNTYGWGITGENENYAVIRQHTANIPVLQVGSSAGASHTINLRRFMLTYNSAQPVTNTNAYCLLFESQSTLSSVYWSTFENLQFWNGYYAIGVTSNARSPWGSKFDMITSYNQTGGFFNDSLSYTSGVPNNVWGRATIDCDTAAGPMFNAWRGYNTVIGSIEFLRATQGAQLIKTAAGFTADIGSLKLEVGSYTGVGKGIFEFSSPCHIRVGSISVGGTGTTFTPSSGILSIVRTSGTVSNGANVSIGSLTTNADTLTGSCVAFNGTTPVVVDSVDLQDGWVLQSTGSTVTGNNLKVSGWVNDWLSGNKGDADYTVALGDPNVVHFNTAFTAQRTIILPASTGNDLFAGLYYDLIFDGAINGANTAVIKRGSTTMRTQTVDKKRLRYQWRRGAASGEWVLIDVSDIGSVTTVGNSLLTAADAAAARTAIGAGTSDLAIGTTSTTAKVGDYQPTSTNISDSTATGRSLLTAVDASAARTTLAAAKNTVVELFTSSGTWTKPTGAVAVRVRCVGPGGSGGAGALGPSGTALSGGGGGSSGGTSEMVFDAADLTATVTVTVGTGGAASSGQTSSSTAGASGNAGTGNSSFGTYLFGGRGAGGTGGGLAVAGAGGTISTSGFGYGMQTGVAGGAGSATGAAGAAGGSGGSAGGGGGGGGINAAGTVATAGGGGGITFSAGLTGGTAGSAAVGGNGVASGIRGPGTGGGGGGAGLAAGGNGYNGGTGGVYGAGGGGGGAALNTYTSGGGGAGGDGVCIVTTYF